MLGSCEKHLHIMPLRCSPCLMLALPQQPNTTSYFLIVRSRTWSLTLMFPGFGISSHLMKSLGCILCKCWTKCLSQKNIGHVSLPRFSSWKGIVVWEGSDGLATMGPVSSCNSKSRAAGMQLKPLSPICSLAVFIPNPCPELVVVRAHSFSCLNFYKKQLSIKYMWLHCSFQMKTVDVCPASCCL